jgi:hypothetical protein
MSNISKELEQILLADCERAFLTRKQRQTVRKAMNTVEQLSEQLTEAQNASDFYETQMDMYYGMYEAECNE